jgi:nucleoside 2-deoxyribosyltransferase
MRFKALAQTDRAMLSAYTRELYEHDSPIPDLAALDTEGQIERIIEKFKKKTVFEKLDNLILYLGKKSHFFGEPLFTDKLTDFPLTYSNNDREFEKMFQYAISVRYISHPGPQGGGGNTVLEMKGWERAEKLLESGPQSKVCFVAMSFNRELDEIYEGGIAAAISEAGYEPNRVDLAEHNEKICDFIIKEIRASKFMVADASFQRANVLFEAGFAYGLNRPVIWTCRKDTKIEDIFDTRQYFHIIWENAEDLKKRLYNRIKATIL